MFEDINISSLLIILLFMYSIIPSKPNFITNFLNDFSIFKWVILFFIIMRDNHNIMLFVVILMIYIVLYIYGIIYCPQSDDNINDQQSLYV